MKIRGLLFLITLGALATLLLSQLCSASTLNTGNILPGFQGTQMTFFDRNGIFLYSNNSDFVLGFRATQDPTKFLLAVIHRSSLKTVWSANRDSPVSTSDKFAFDKNGNAFLERGGNVVWSTDTADKGVSSLALQDSGNLALVGNDGGVIWQSFSHPTDTLLSNQEFSEGMRLTSDRGANNLTYFLEINSGDMVLSVSFSTPQPYWSMKKESRKIPTGEDGVVSSASLIANSWRTYDKYKVLLSQFNLSATNLTNFTSMAVLESNGMISFHYLTKKGSSVDSDTKIPEEQCSLPAFCRAYFVCSAGPDCKCLSVLSPTDCQTGIVSPCGSSQSKMQLVDAGNGLSYFALEFLQPFSKTDLNGCKSSCISNCSCLALFFQSSTENCFLIDRVGSFQNSTSGSDYVSYIKILGEERSEEKDGGDDGGDGSDRKHHTLAVVMIAVSTVLAVSGLLYFSYRCMKKKKKKQLSQESLDGSLEEDDKFFEDLTGMPIRFSFKDLQDATNDFSVKLGQGGFGSVYRGSLPDGTRVAVKKLEGIGQGKKEFRAEVGIIGSIHHLHLVRLKGFCAEGSHRLLAYEFMANGSLDKWIFKKKKEDRLLDWNRRFNIALGTAKGLAYLHQDCDATIIHCDIKPENVLLDDNFQAKVSDFGLAKLLSREQSQVLTQMRGTRGYLAPEWIVNYAISEKSDVYSYGMVLLEIIAGRKGYDPAEPPEKSHFPSYAFKMMEEGKLQRILDPNLAVEEWDERVSTAIKVAMWCIQEDMALRPAMAKVVQMLEGACIVPDPPATSSLASRLNSNFFTPNSDEGTSSAPSDCNSDAYISAGRLSGPR